MSWILSGAWSLSRRAIGFALAYAALALAVLGAFRHPESGGAKQLLALAGLCIVLVARLFERLQRGRAVSAREARLSDLELGTLFISAAFVLIELTGGPDGLLYPLVYVLVAFLVAFHGWGVSLYFIGLILGAEAAIGLAQSAPFHAKLFVSHASFVLLIGFLYALFMRGEVLERRQSLHQAIHTRLREIAAEAENFRLTSGLSWEGRELDADELRMRRRIGSVQAIQESLYNVLAVAERALEPHTVALLWMDADDRRMRVKELRSQSDHVIEKPVGAGEGLVGAIVKRREPIVLTNLKRGHPGLVYYRHPEPVTDFAGVPVMEGRHLRGVLVADRSNGQPFSEADQAVLTTIAGEIVRAVQVERIFSEMDTEKYQRERFYEASRAFNQALTVGDVSAVAVEVVRKAAQVEFGAVAVAVPDREGVMRLQAVEAAAELRLGNLEGEMFAAEQGLVGASIKARHPLPHGTARGSGQHIFDERLKVDLPYVKVLPLLWKDTGVGALVLASGREDFLSLDLIDMLKVVADHAAIAIANAQMYERMERMATTDGLTGLVNHRHFQGLFDNALARAERYGRPLSVILTDIDHFKSVNDTYGHPVGDRVLKVVARVLEQGARKTDVVARYGGEEFAILLDETDTEGAVQIAERIREAVQAKEFHTEHGRFSCTLSLGVSTFPHDAQTKADLIEGADQALYKAKGTGRNQVVTFASVKLSR